MGDVVEEIVAEPEESSWLQELSTSANFLIRSYGWYLVIGVVTFWYLWRRKEGTPAAQTGPKTQKELEAWQRKEEQRLKTIQRLQQKYDEDAAKRAEELKKIEEEKRQAKLAEKEKLVRAVEGGK